MRHYPAPAYSGFTPAFCSSSFHCAVSRTTLKGTVYLPVQGSPDRDAAAAMALALFFFNDPGTQSR